MEQGLPVSGRDQKGIAQIPRGDKARSSDPQKGERKTPIREDGVEELRSPGGWSTAIDPKWKKAGSERYEFAGSKHFNPKVGKSDHKMIL